MALVQPLIDNKNSRAMWGTVRSIINVMVKDVRGFTQELEIKGVCSAGKRKLFKFIIREKLYKN